MTLFAYIAVALVMSSGSSSIAESGGERGDTITGEELVDLIDDATRRGAPDVDRVNLVVTGDVDLRPLRTVSRPLRCTQCTFDGQVLATDVAFGASIDLTASTFAMPVDISGATFEGRLTLDSAEFDGGLEARDARFFARTSFDDVRVGGDARFDLATFDERAILSRTRFDRLASFAGASFTAAAEFTSSSFHDSGDFEDAAFNAGGSFVATQFQHDATFVGVSLNGELDFGFAIFDGAVTFSEMRGPGTLLLERIALPPPSGDGAAASPLGMSNLALAGLVMDLDQVAAIRGPDTALPVLELIEETARERGDIGTANRAHFELLSRQNGDLSQPWRFLDAVFYGGAAGYLVRLRNPVVCLLGLLVSGGLIRAVPRIRLAWGALRPQDDAKASRGRKRLLAAKALAVSVAVGLCQGLSRALARSWSVRSRPEPVPEQQPSAPARIRPYLLSGLRWGEWLAVKLLIAAALIVIANANARIRELVDAVT